MGAVIDPDTKEARRALNRLAREQMKLRLLNDIRLDLAICEIEGLPKAEFITELLDLVKGFADKIKA